MKNAFVLLFAILLGMFFSPVKSTAQVDSSFINLFNEAIDFQMLTQGDKSLGVAVVLPDGQFWWGQKGIDQFGNPITDTTLFMAASLTKTFVAACALELQEEGLLNLDQAYTQYIAALPNVEPTSTLRQLLNHTAGVHDFQANPAWFPDLFTGMSFAPGEVLDTYLDQPHDFAPGTGWNYSSSNYVVAGLVIEAVTNKTLHENLRTRFIEPLGLTHTWCGGFENYTSPDAGIWMPVDTTGILVDFSTVPRTTLLTQGFGIGYIVSTPHDMALWAKALYKDRTVLSEDAFGQMFTIAPQSVDVFSPGWAYGLGLYRASVNTDNTEFGYGHFGNLIHQSAMLWDEKKDYLVVTMTNSATVNGFAAFQYIYFTLREMLPSAANEQVAMPDVLVFPNPASDEVWLAGDFKPNTIVQITDMSGKVIFQQRLDNPTNHLGINVTNWQTGLYAVHVAMPNGRTWVGKFAVQ